MKARILNHLNADHRTSLRLYARHYSHLPLSHAKTATADDISLDHLILVSSFGRTLIPFTPPLISFSEARERLVSMHEECLRELDVEGVMVDFCPVPDKVVYYVWMAFCSWVVCTLPLGEMVLPESRTWVASVWSVGGYVPGLARLAYQLGPATMWFIGVVHAVEAVVMVRGRLRRCEVEVFSKAWWGWVVDVLLTGFGGMSRFDEVVRGLKEKKERPTGLGKPKVEH